MQNVCFFAIISKRINGGLMKYSTKTINNIRAMVESDEIKEKYKIKKTDFIRNRKMSFKNVVYYNLNKKGITSKMEIEDFTDMINMIDISNVAVLKQREKLNAEVYNEMRNRNLETFYNEYKTEVKLFKGFVLAAVDGSYFEIPNTLNNRQNFGGVRKGTSSPRALVSNYFDILNHYILNTVIDRETADERKLADKGWSELQKLNIPYPILRIKDRGYVSIKDFYYSNLNNEKYLVRLKKSDYKKQIDGMESDDEIIELKYNRSRMNYYKNVDPDFSKLLEEKRKSIYIRIVKIELSNGDKECLATNLTKEEATTDDIKELYNLRWQIELNYHLLKESLKIETITSSKIELIKQDVYSQMLAFNILQSFIVDAQKELEQKQNNYKYEMKVNMNMAVGFIKKSLILILIEENKDEQIKLLELMSKKIQKYLVPIRNGRKYPRDKNKFRNKYSLNKRKSF